jgi:hypothetical protein
MPDQDNIDDRQLEERLRRAFRWMADDSGRAVSLPAGPQGVAGSRDDSTSDGETPLYLDDPAPLSLRRRTGRTAVLATAAVVILAAVGVSLGIVATGSGGHGSGAGGSSRTADSKAQVVSALSATTSAGNWDISYSYGEVAGSVPTTTIPTPTMLPCSPPQVGCAELPVVRPDPQNVTVTGTGVIDVNPKAMVTDANVSNFGRVVLRIDATQVWELLSVDSGGLAPGGDHGRRAVAVVVRGSGRGHARDPRGSGRHARDRQPHRLPRARRAGHHRRDARGDGRGRRSVGHRVPRVDAAGSTGLRPECQPRTGRGHPGGGGHTRRSRTVGDLRPDRCRCTGLHHSVDYYLQFHRRRLGHRPGGLQ